MSKMNFIWQWLTADEIMQVFWYLELVEGNHDEDDYKTLLRCIRSYADTDRT